MRFFSLRLPFGMYAHFRKGRKIGESRSTYDKGLVHYDIRRKVTGRMVRSFFGEPNHYAPQGRTLGYSRRSGLGKIVHFDRAGKPVGYTRSFLSVLYFHHVSEQSDLWVVLRKRRVKKEFENG